MSDRNNQVITYVTDAEYRQLKEWSDDTGKSMSHLLREAVLEYVDHDRTRRIEEKVDRLLEVVDASDAGEHTHTNTGQKSVPEKARAVADHIYQQYDAPIKADDVEVAIENIARVGDDRSVEKYKQQLKKRDLLFAHPHQPVWTDNKEEWVGWVEGASVGGDVPDEIDDYRMDRSEYVELVEELNA